MLRAMMNDGKTQYSLTLHRGLSTEVSTTLSNLEDKPGRSSAYLHNYCISCLVEFYFIIFHALLTAYCPVSVPLFKVDLKTSKTIAQYRSYPGFPIEMRSRCGEPVYFTSRVKTTEILGQSDSGSCLRTVSPKPYPSHRETHDALQDTVKV